MKANFLPDLISATEMMNLFNFGHKSAIFHVFFIKANFDAEISNAIINLTVKCDGNSVLQLTYLIRHKLNFQTMPRELRLDIVMK